MIYFLERLTLDFEAGMRSNENLFFIKYAAFADIHWFQKFKVIVDTLWHFKKFIASRCDFLAKLSAPAIYWDFEKYGNGLWGLNVFIWFKVFFYNHNRIQRCRCKGGKSYYFLEVYFELFELGRCYKQTAVAFFISIFKYILWLLFLEA